MESKVIKRVIFICALGVMIALPNICFLLYGLESKNIRLISYQASWGMDNRHKWKPANVLSHKQVKVDTLLLDMEMLQNRVHSNLIIDGDTSDIRYVGISSNHDTIILSVKGHGIFRGKYFLIDSILGKMLNVHCEEYNPAYIDPKIKNAKTIVGDSLKYKDWSGDDW